MCVYIFLKVDLLHCDTFFSVFVVVFQKFITFYDMFTNVESKMRPIFCDIQSNTLDPFSQKEEKKYNSTANT